MLGKSLYGRWNKLDQGFWERQQAERFHVKRPQPFAMRPTHSNINMLKPIRNRLFFFSPWFLKPTQIKIILLLFFRAEMLKARILWFSATFANRAFPWLVSLSLRGPERTPRFKSTDLGLVIGPHTFLSSVCKSPFPREHRPVDVNHDIYRMVCNIPGAGRWIPGTLCAEKMQAFQRRKGWRQSYQQEVKAPYIYAPKQHIEQHQVADAFQSWRG